MSFKLYDLKPVEHKKTSEAHIREEKVSYTKKTKSGGNKTWLKIIIGIIIVIAVFIVATRFMHARATVIEIWPQTKDQESQLTMSAKQDLPAIDFESKTISATQFTKEFIISKQFDASSKSFEGKAEGVIKVTSKYNKSVPLVANTRFVSSTNPSRMFLSKKKFTVPANGTVDVPVIASEPGADFNIDPCVFSIPGLRNSSPATLYSSITGKSLAKMQGGKTGEVNQISQDDLDKAKNELEIEADDKATQELKTVAGQDYIVLDKTVETTIKQSGAVDAQVGQTRDNFLYQLTIDSKTLAVKQADIITVINKYLEAQQFSNLDIKEGSVAITKVESIRDAQQNITLNIDFGFQVYPQLDLIQLKDIAKNQKPANIKRYVRDVYPEMKTEPKVIFKPFFAGKASSQIGDIEIKLMFK